MRLIIIALCLTSIAYAQTTPVSINLSGDVTITYVSAATGFVEHRPGQPLWHLQLLIPWKRLFQF
jgi:hypothetical protein